MSPHPVASEIPGAVFATAVMAEAPWLPLTGDTDTTPRGFPFWLPSHCRWQVLLPPFGAIFDCTTAPTCYCH